jgi:hypothetical protein
VWFVVTPPRNIPRYEGCPRKQRIEQGNPKEGVKYVNHVDATSFLHRQSHTSFSIASPNWITRRRCFLSNSSLCFKTSRISSLISSGVFIILSKRKKYPFKGSNLGFPLEGGRPTTKRDYQVQWIGSKGRGR